MRISGCKHLPEKFAKPRAEKCYVACCDSCAQHMRKHAAETGHEVMAYYPADENSLIWCYADDDYLEPDEKINMIVKR